MGGCSPEKDACAVAMETAHDRGTARMNLAQAGQPEIVEEWMPRSILLASDAISATQHISFLRPLQALVDAGALAVRAEGDSKRLNASVVNRMFKEAAPELVILSRYTFGRSKHFIDAARARGIPVIFHIDDDLLDVPMSLGAEKYEMYHRPERLATLRDAMDSCDMVYASTRPLGAQLASHGIRAPIVPGDLYCAVDPGAVLPPFPSTLPVIGYMGTGGHGQDLELIGPAIERLLDTVPALCFETFGTIAPLPRLARFGARVAHHGPTESYASFIEKLNRLGWWAGLAPIEDNPFNRCKADTKWVEYSFAGLPTVAQALPVYDRACADGTGFQAGTQEEWTKALLDLVTKPALRRRVVEAAQAKLRESYAFAVMRRQLARIFAQARAQRAAGAAL